MLRKFPKITQMLGGRYDAEAPSSISLIHLPDPLGEAFLSLLS